GGAKLKLLGGPTLLTFGPPELSFDGGLVKCRHAIQGGLLALRAGGSVTLAPRPGGGGAVKGRARDPGGPARAPSRRLRHTRTATRGRGRSAGAERHGQGVPAA